MQSINYFLASITSFSGLLIGLILMKIAQEEQKPLKKYFVLFRKILLFVIFAFLVFYYFNEFFYFIALILLMLFLLLIEYKVKDLSKSSALIYAILGILFYLSSKNTNLFAIESSLILMYGLPAMSLIYNKNKSQQMLPYSAAFIAVSNLLFLTTSRFLF